MSKELDISAGKKIARPASQIIELGEKPVPAKVIREGFQVPIVPINKEKASFTIENLATVLPRSLPRVISQSIAPKTKVTRGTVIDFVVVPKQDIPFNIFDDLHESLANKTLTHVDPIVENPAVREVLLKNESVRNLAPADKAILDDAFQKNGIVVDEKQPGKTFERAFNSVRGATAFR
ncbi:MAG TPA: hypothetical protein VEW46_01430 [Pyrinomonadaceae bacterium]|nr:hypothetical protein [Pyrinomonadaceae bacterium]